MKTIELTPALYELVNAVKNQRLAWHIKARFIYTIHQDLLKQFKDYWKLEDTSEILGKSPKYLEEYLGLAQAIEKYPNIIKLNRREQAINLLRNYKDNPARLQLILTGILLRNGQLKSEINKK